MRFAVCRVTAAGTSVSDFRTSQATCDREPHSIKCGHCVSHLPIIKGPGWKMCNCMKNLPYRTLLPWIDRFSHVQINYFCHMLFVVGLVLLVRTDNIRSAYRSGRRTGCERLGLSPLAIRGFLRPLSACG